MAGNTVNIANAVIAISVNAKEAEEGIKKTQSLFQMGMKKIWDMVSNPAVGMQLVQRIAAFTETYLNDARDIANYAGLIGEKTNDVLEKNMADLSRLSTLASDVGVEFSQIADVLVDLNEKITEKDIENGPLGFFLKKEGKKLNLKDENGKLKSTLEILSDIAEIAKEQGPQAATGLLKKLGINDPKILALLLNAEKSLAERVGKVNGDALINKDDIDNAAKFRKNLQELSRGLKNTVIPILGGLVWILANLTNNLYLLIPAVLMASHALGVKLAGSLDKIKSILSANKGFLKYIAALSVFMLLIDDLKAWVESGGNNESAMFGGVFEAIFGSPENAKGLLSTLEQFGGLLPLFISLIIGLFSGAFKSAKSVLKAAGYIKTFAGELRTAALAAKAFAATSLIPTIVGYMKTFIGIVKTAAIAVKAFSVSTLIAMGPYIAAAAAFSAALYLIYIYWDDICDAVSKAVKLIGDAIDAAEAWFEEFKKNPIDAIINLLDSWWTAIGDWFKEKAGSFNLADLFTFLNPGTYAISKIREFLGSSDDGMALAAAGGGSVNNNVEATQTIVQNFNGDTSKQTIEAATAGATDGGLTAAVNSGNHG